MANPEHVKVVRQGAAAIAEWRLQNPGVRLDLTEADLAGADLTKADLSWAALVAANFAGANLDGASLVESQLIEAELTGAKLRDTTLLRANLHRAHLTGADLTRGDLRQADLSEANLHTADLSQARVVLANLFRADVSGATLIAADFIGANLTEADLSGANLTEAHLDLANLLVSNLRGANLGGAYLVGANFFGVDLSGANLSGAHFDSSSLGNCDLSQAAGLSTVNHSAPSSIGVDTLIDSFRGAGNRFTPDLEAFFLGAGVPKELLAELPRIVAEVKYYSCFVCYGQPDLDFAKKLHDDLVTSGVSCWIYDLDATPGEPTWGEIGRKRREADRMVVICSVGALIRDGALKEIEEQIDEDPDKMIPISRDNDWTQPGFRVMRGTNDLKPFLLAKNYADFSDESCYDESLQRLLKALRRKAG